MYDLIIARSKYIFILTLKLIMSRENVDSKQAKIVSFSHAMQSSIDLFKC